MKNRRWLIRWLAAGVGAIVVMPESAQACAVCFGNPEAPMSQGMSWAIMSLLFIIASVLGGIVAMSVFVARRAATVSAQSLEAEQARAFEDVLMKEEAPVSREEEFELADK